jgi:glutamate dehydrogenase/leucine dehydrogenase
VGIIDRVGGVMRPEGLGFDEVKALFLAKEGNALRTSDLLGFQEVNEQIWDMDAEVFLPCAASRLVTQNQVERMAKSGVEVISSGANVPFADLEIFYGAIAEYADERMAVIPDFIANCGMARVFAYLMGDEDVDMSDAAIFEDTSSVIREALAKVLDGSDTNTHVTAKAFERALGFLV